MKTCTKCKEIKSLQKFGIDKRHKDGRHSQCRICMNKQTKEWRKNNLEKKRKMDRAYAAANLEQNRSRAKKWAKDNSKINRNRVKMWKKENPHKVNENSRKWAKNNRGAINAKTAKHRAAKFKATPPWLTPEQENEIRAIYKEAIKLTKEKGVSYHVDHIYPLQGEIVSGLHVPWNLQILEASKNCSKGNKINFKEINKNE